MTGIVEAETQITPTCVGVTAVIDVAAFRANKDIVAAVAIFTGSAIVSRGPSGTFLLSTVVIIIIITVGTAVILIRAGTILQR